MGIRLGTDLVESLKVVARKESVKRNENITWATLVREMIVERLKREHLKINKDI